MNFRSRVARERTRAFFPELGLDYIKIRRLDGRTRNKGNVLVLEETNLDSRSGNTRGEFSRELGTPRHPSRPSSERSRYYKIVHFS